MNATPPKLKRATRHEAQTAWSRLNAKQRNSVVGRTYQSIIELLDDTGTIALGPLLDAQFADRDLRAAHTALKTQFISRPPRDESDQPLMQICVSPLPKLRGGGEAERLQALREAQVWFDIPENVSAEDFRVTAPDDVAQHFTETRATDRSSEETLAQSKSDALRTAETAQVASARSTSLFHGTQSIRGLDHHGPFLPGHGMDAPLGKKRDERHTDLDETTDADATSTATEAPAQVVALPTLLKWARNSDVEAPRLYALLGDSGTGKTSHAQEFARVLNGESTHSDWPSPDAVTGKEPALPKALFFDLADLSGVPNLEQLSLEEMLVLLLKRRDGVRIQVVADVAPLIADARAGRLIFVFDGLDELLKTDPLVLQKVFEQLIKVVERPSAARTPAPPAQRPPKVIVSCRTHYFRDVETQHSFFLARGRGAVKATDYRVLTLLPWNAELIERYLASRVGAAEAARLLRVIQTTYNLSELASRPVLLAMMCGTLEALLSRADQGEHIDAAALYSETVAAWIHRDNGKHRLSAAQKPLLMGALATAMWNDGSELWPADRLDQWVLRTVRELFPNQYSPVELRGIQDDLRTATFIVRPDAQQFNFAHRSYGEYFTARFLLEGMSQVADGFWSLATLRAYLPTRALGPETHDFLVEMWRSDQRKLPAQTLKRRTDVLLQLLQGGDAAPVPAPPLHAALWQLVCTTRSPLSSVGNANGASHATDDAINLRGLDFSDQRWEDLDFTHAPPLDLRGASLRGLYALDCHFGVVRSDASTNWSQAVLRGCITKEINWANSMRGGVLVRAAAPRFDANPSPLPGPWALPINLGPINCLSASPDSTTLASGGNDGVVRLWDIATGRELGRLKSHDGWVESIVYAPDGQTVATGSTDGCVRLFDPRTGRAIAKFEGKGRTIWTIAFSRDGKTLAAGSDDDIVYVWDTENRRKRRSIRFERGGGQSVAFSPDGQTLAAGNRRGEVHLWDAATLRERGFLVGHGGPVNGVAFSPDGHTLAYSSDDVVLLWDMANAREYATFSGRAGWVKSVAFSSDGRTFASGHADGTVHLWDVINRRELAKLSAHEASITSIAFVPGGLTVASAGNDSKVRLWDTATQGQRIVIQGQAEMVSGIAFLPCGRTLASGGNDGKVRLWDLEHGCERTGSMSHKSSVSCVTVSPDGGTLISGDIDGNIHVWDLRTQRELAVYKTHNWTRSVAISPDGRSVASSGDDGMVRLRSIATGVEYAAISANGGWVRSAVFSLDGSMFAFGDETGAVHICDAADGDERDAFERHQSMINCVAFSPDGRLLASGDEDGVVRLWADGREHSKTKRGSSQIAALAFSHDGHILVVGCKDGTLRFWDVKNMREVATFNGHSDSVTGVTFSPDGNTLASSSDDGTVRLWSWTNDTIPRGTPHRVILAHPREPFSPSWADFTATGELADWSDNAPDHWLFYLGRGRSEPLEAAL